MLTFLFAAFLLLLSSACIGGPTTPSASLDEARARWAQSHPASYELTLRRSCGECPVDLDRPVVIVVRSGVVESRRFSDTGADVSPALAASFPAVDGLFGVVSDAIERNAFALSANYDPTLGYPRYISIDYNAQVVDDETAYSVLSFKVL